MATEMDPLIFSAAGAQPLNDDEIDRLIELAGTEPKSREQLKQELGALPSWCWMFRGPYPTRSDVRQHAKQVENATRRLLDLIDPDNQNGAWRDIIGPASDWSLADRMPDLSVPSRPSLEALRNGIQYLHDLSRQLREPRDRTSQLAQLLNAGGSKFGGCIADLVRIYEGQFGRKASCKRRADGEPYGEFLDFAEFCVNQLNFMSNVRLYERETIIKALSKQRSRQKRRSRDK